MGPPIVRPQRYEKLNDPIDPSTFDTSNTVNNLNPWMRTASHRTGRLGFLPPENLLETLSRQGNHIKSLKLHVRLL